MSGCRKSYNNHTGEAHRHACVAELVLVRQLRPDLVALSEEREARETTTNITHMRRQPPSGQQHIPGNCRPNQFSSWCNMLPKHHSSMTLPGTPASPNCYSCLPAAPTGWRPSLRAQRRRPSAPCCAVTAVRVVGRRSSCWTQRGRVRSCGPTTRSSAASWRGEPAGLTLIDSILAVQCSSGCDRTHRGTMVTCAGRAFCGVR